MRLAARLGVAAAVVTIAAAVLAGIGGGATVTGTVAAIKLNPKGQEAAQGVAFLHQVGKKVTGWVVVWGLDPNSEHAMHIHGPNGSCTKDANVVVPFADIKSDAKGVAFAQISGTGKGGQVLKKGFYLNVHDYKTADLGTKGLEAVACGDITSVK